MKIIGQYYSYPETVTVLKENHKTKIYRVAYTTGIKNRRNG